MANLIYFDDLVDPFELIEPDHFRQQTEYGYDPSTDKPDPSTTPVVEYWVSMLVRGVDKFTALRTKLLNQQSDYSNNGNVTRLPIVVQSDKSLGADDGTYEVFWLLEGEWYTRLGSTEFEVNLHGYGSPLSGSGSITPNQSFSIAEDASFGTVVGIVQGFSDTLLLEGRPDLPFDYDPSTGTLSVGAAGLDFETTPEYTLSIGGTDVVVYILDVIEEPTVTRSDYDFYISPDSQAGSSVGTVEAQQQGDSGTLPQFTFVSGNTNNNFAIDKYTGEIIVLSLQGINDGHTLTVNYGHSTDTVTCIIHLLTGLGELDLPDVRFDLIPHPQDGAVIGTFTDAALQYATSNYEVDCVANQLVVVDGSNNAFTEGVLNYSISVTDPTTGRQGEFTAYVNVYDPSKLTAYQEFWISIDSSNGSAVGTVSFPGIDPGSITLTYTLETAGTPFAINSQTGEIIVSQSSILAVSTYQLVVSANSQAYSRNVRVVVYDVVTQVDTSFTVASDAAVGVVVGTITGVVLPVTVSSGSLGTFALDLATGVITVATSPPTNASFTVQDSGGDEVAVEVTIDTGSDTGDTEYLGAVFAGQSGQAIAGLSNIRYSVGSVGFGQGSLNVRPNSNSSYSRTLAGTIVVNQPTTANYELTVSTETTRAMLDELLGYYLNTPPVKYTVSVSGRDWEAYMVSFQMSYGETDTVQLTLLTE